MLHPSAHKSIVGIGGKIKETVGATEVVIFGDLVAEMPALYTLGRSEVVASPPTKEAAELDQGDGVLRGSC